MLLKRENLFLDNDPSRTDFTNALSTTGNCIERV